MWPQRKILLVFTQTSYEWDGLKALLSGAGLAFKELIYSKEQISSESYRFTEDSLEEKDVLQSLYTGVTEVICQDILAADNRLLSFAQTKGLEITPVSAFLQRFFRQERVLPVREPNRLQDEVPLLWTILEQAGFEPSLLWPLKEQWICKVGRGIHWVVPEGWLAGDLTEWENDRVTVNKWVANSGEEICRFTEHEEVVDFYDGSQGREFVGSLSLQSLTVVDGEKRLWPENDSWLNDKSCSLQEHNFKIKDDSGTVAAICDAIQKAIELGVSWFDIRETLLCLQQGLRAASTAASLNEEHTELLSPVVIERLPEAESLEERAS